jgi:L-asparagine transporter-like permease
MLVTLNIAMWLGICYAQHQSKKIGVTEVTDKRFFEPTVNMMTLVTLLSLCIIFDI